uniref:Uncharacterized protein n=1 Tax=Arion vulgaris TaxID=1028688 RepID=A0A0B7BD19_9EUPU
MTSSQMFTMLHIFHCLYYDLSPLVSVIQPDVSTIYCDFFVLFSITMLFSCVLIYVLSHNCSQYYQCVWVFLIIVNLFTVKKSDRKCVFIFGQNLTAYEIDFFCQQEEDQDERKHQEVDTLQPERVQHQGKRQRMLEVHCSQQEEDGDTRGKETSRGGQVTAWQSAISRQESEDVGGRLQSTRGRRRHKLERSVKR